LLQLPILPATLHPATGDAPAPVALLAQVAVQRQRQLQQRALQIDIQRLATLVATPLGLQAPEIGIADANTTQIEIDARLLASIQRRVQLQLTYAGVTERQTLAGQGQLALRRLQGASQGQLPLHLPLQTGPELSQTRQ